MGDADFKAGDLSCFKDIVPALFEYQDRYAERVRAEFVMTEVARITFERLDRALRRKKIVILEGREGIGKSEAAKAWCQMHCGQARFIDLKGITSKTEFFRKICKALGLGSSAARKMSEMKALVEELLGQTKLLLVIDEAHQLLPAGERVTTKPEMIEWIYTITNSGVPVVLLTTSLFMARIHQIEQRIIWNWGQVDRRSEYCPLPQVTPRQDLEAIGRKKLPGASNATIKLLVGHAGASTHQLTAMADVIEDAKELAASAGRQQIAFEDIDQAIKLFRLPSESAKAAARMAAAQRSKPGRKRVCKPQEAAMQGACTDDETFNVASIPPGRRMDLPDVESGETPSEPVPANRRLTGQLLEA